MSAAKAPALSVLVTLEKEERAKQWKAFIFMSPNLLQLYVRVQARTGGVRVRGRCLLAQWQALNGCILPFLWGRTQTHIHTAIPGDSPQERPRNTTHHCLITPVPKDRREECRKVLPLTQNRRCTVYH